MEKNVNQFLETLRNDPKAKELMKGMKKPESDEEIIDSYAAIAEKIGFDLSRDEIREGVSGLIKEQQAKAMNAAEQVQKTALGEEDLENIAGGWDPNCNETYSPGEWCWFSDSCSYLIRLYDDNTVTISLKEEDPKDDEWHGN